MIIEPDFPDHWKTEMLVQLSGDEIAVRCLIRLWAYCQYRKRWEFKDMIPVKMKGICKWSGCADKWWNALSASEWIDIYEDGSISVHEWDKYNSRLIHNWKVGVKGGRPKKKVNGPKNPRVTVKKPRGYSNETQGVTHRLDREDREDLSTSNMGLTKTVKQVKGLAKKSVKRKPLRVRTDTSKHPQFESAWLAYPKTRRQDKKDCFGKWVKNDYESIGDQIIESIEHFKKTQPDWVKDPDGQFAPNFLTFINRRRWEDLDQAELFADKNKHLKQFDPSKPVPNWQDYVGRLRKDGQISIKSVILGWKDCELIFDDIIGLYNDENNKFQINWLK